MTPINDLIPKLKMKLEIGPTDDIRLEVLRARPDHAVYRLFAGERRWILKTFDPQQTAREVEVYRLLTRLGVPVLPVAALGDAYLVIEDLESSPRWRLARDEDMRRAEVGRGVAEWYQILHRAGAVYLREVGGHIGFLSGWVERLDEQELRQAGFRLGIDNEPAWQMALHQLNRLKAVYHSYPQTFNYSDFAAENLAVSRGMDRPVQAIIFDYDCFTTGTAYGDYRNVVYSLEGEAREAFRESFGPVDPGEETMDTVLSTLEGIGEAAKHEKFPGWAAPLIPFIRSEAFVGDVERLLII
jgi:hypothetical protein